MRKFAADRHRMLAGALLSLFLSVFVLTISETLHRAFHADACEPQHQCAVTMLQSGQVEMPVVSVSAEPARESLIAVLLAESDFVPAVPFRLPPSCGPPALCS